MTEYVFENGALYRLVRVDAYVSRKELVITRDEFVMCFIKWIFTGSEV